METMREMAMKVKRFENSNSFMLRIIARSILKKKRGSIYPQPLRWWWKIIDK